MKYKKRKHWFDYPKDSHGYGNWNVSFEGKKYYGFGIYLCDRSDAWLDFESATPSEKKEYKAYCKARGFKYDEGEL